MAEPIASSDLSANGGRLLSRHLPGASDRPEREPRRPPQPPPSREPARPGGISASIVKYLSCGAKAPSPRGRWSSFGWSHPGRIDPMIGGSGVDSAGLGASATVLKMFYSSGGAYRMVYARSLRDRVVCGERGSNKLMLYFFSLKLLL